MCNPVLLWASQEGLTGVSFRVCLCGCPRPGLSPGSLSQSGIRTVNEGVCAGGCAGGEELDGGDRLGQVEGKRKQPQMQGFLSGGPTAWGLLGPLPSFREVRREGTPS